LRFVQRQPAFRTCPASTFRRRLAPYVTRTDRGDARPCGFSL
jgi:hypothetical protein